MANFRIIPNGYRRSYQLIEVMKNRWRIVRILQEYDNEEQAENDLFDLVQGKITDEDLLKQLKCPFVNQ